MDAMEDVAKADKLMTTHHGAAPSARRIVEAGGAQPAFERRRGRGASLNTSGRYERERRVAFDDGWQSLEDLPPFKTEVQVEAARTIITRNTSPDVPFDRSINPYRGCEHGCSYCFARPTHAFMGMSAGLDFESRLFVKRNAADLLERELSRPGYTPAPIAIGTNTDPYQPVEKTHMTTRTILEVLDATDHPVSITTKSALILRDIDILSSMATRGLVRTCLSITTLDHKLSRALEPRASTPTKRLDAIRQLAQAHIPVSVNAAPMIPALNDHELERILDCAAAAGAEQADYILLRLPQEVSPLFKDWLLQHVPDRYRHIMSLIRSMRGGRDYDANWGKRMRGEGPYAWQIKRRFDIQMKKLGMRRKRLDMRCDLFKAPKPGGVQLSLL